MKRIIFIIPAADLARANAQAKSSFDQRGGERTFTTRLSATGAEPATHFVCSGLLADDDYTAVKALLATYPLALTRMDPPVLTRSDPLPEGRMDFNFQGGGQVRGKTLAPPRRPRAVLIGQGRLTKFSVHSESLGFLQLRSRRVFDLTRGGIATRRSPRWGCRITWCCDRCCGSNPG